MEGHRFKAIWKIMGAMKSFYPYNNLIVWRFRDFLDIENFLLPILPVFTIVFLDSRSGWLIQKPQNNLFFRSRSRKIQRLPLMLTLFSLPWHTFIFSLTWGTLYFNLPFSLQ